VLAFACALAAFGTPARAATVVQSASGKLRGIVPQRGHVTRLAAPSGQAAPTSNLEYHGGPVMHTNKTYSFYWKPTAYASDYASGFRTLVDRYLADVAADSGQRSSVYAANTQYYDNTTGHILHSSIFGGSLTDTTSFPSATCLAARSSQCITDAQIKTELNGFLTANGLPRGLGTQYFVLLPPGIVVCFGTAAGSDCSGPGGTFCAYHGDFVGAGSSTIYAVHPYPDPTGCDPGDHPNANADADSQINLISHEHNEAITDPLTSPAGWYDDSSGEENGDLCAWTFGTALGGASGSRWNQVLNGDHYWLQREWSNYNAGCVLSFPNLNPAASFTASPASAPTGSQVSFDGSASSDGDGSVASYGWNFGDGTTGTGATPKHTYATPNTYTVQLTVTDNDGGTGTTTRSVTATNRPPTASFSLSPNPAVTGQEVSFDGTASSDLDGTISNYSWNFGDGSTGSGSAPSHAYQDANTYTVTLTVTDNKGAPATTTHTVTVNGSTNQQPTASFSLSPNPALTGQQVSFDATTSSDPDGTISSYSWDFGDGTTGSGATASHAYSAVSTYTVTLSVTDNRGGTDTTTHTVTVNAPPSSGAPPTLPSTQQIVTPPLTTTTFPTTTTTPSPVLLPTIAFLSTQRSITVSRTRVFSYSFTGRPASARGRISFGTAKAIAAVRRRKLSLGSASFTARGSVRTTVTIKLSRANFAILTRKRSLSVKASVTIGAVTKTAVFTLRAPKR
jgi:PKD repeat protein